VITHENFTIMSGCLKYDSGGGGGVHSEIHKLIMLIWNEEELPHQWKESIVISIHQKGDKTDCSNY
jgi:hypothetical protein